MVRPKDRLVATPGGHLYYGDRPRCMTVLRGGGALILPSDGGYSLAADASSRSGTATVRAGTSVGDAPLSVAFDDTERLEKFVRMNAVTARLMEHLLPGPLTIVSQLSGYGARALGQNLNPFGTIGCRITDSPIEQRIAGDLGGPITTTAIRDDRGDIVTDPHDALAIAQAGIESAGIDVERPSTFLMIRADSAFTYPTHSTVVDATGRPSELGVLREGQTPFRKVQEAATRLSRWEWSDGT